MHSPARDLMASVSTLFKAGYSQVNAVLVAAELSSEVAADAVHSLIHARLAERTNDDCELHHDSRLDLFKRLIRGANRSRK